MPYDQVLSKFKKGTLESGSGDKVKSKKQALAIMLSEKREADKDKKEYKPDKKRRGFSSYGRRKQ